MVIIGLIGPMGSGKTAIAHLLEEKLNGLLFSYADPLREILQIMIGNSYSLNRLAPHEKNTKILPVINTTYRKFMTSFGTDYAREVLGDNVWLNHMSSRLELAEKQGAKFVIIDDIRFLNELELIAAKNALSVFINRNALQSYYNKIKHSSDSEFANHKSELLSRDTYIIDKCIDVVEGDLLAAAETIKCLAVNKNTRS